MAVAQFRRVTSSSFIESVEPRRLLAAAPSDIVLSSSSVSENLPVGTVVAQISATDADVGDKAVFDLVAGPGAVNNGDYRIVGNQLQTAQVLDYEMAHSDSIRLSVTDSAGLVFEKVFTITVLNVNEAPYAIVLSRAMIAEGAAPGTVIGSFRATDPDLGDPLTYSLVTGVGSADNGSFRIENGNLLSQGVLDYELRNSYQIRVRATDSGGLSTEQAIAISVTNVDEPPTAMTLSNATIPEAPASGTTVGVLSLVDRDTTDTAHFMFVGGAGSADNYRFTIRGNQLQTSGMLDYETKSAYSIRVRGTDSGGMFVEQTFAISLLNMPETPLVVTGGGGDDVIAISIENGTVMVAVNGAILQQRPSGGISVISVDGGAGNDKISMTSDMLLPASVQGGDGQDSIVTARGNDTIVGGAGADWISAWSGKDSITGGEGPDTLCGDVGADMILGGNGGDVIYGGGANDHIEGNGKADYIDGGSGSDTIMGQAGADILSGGDGDDWIMADDGTPGSRDVIYGGAGVDHVDWDRADNVFQAEVNILT